MNARPFVAIALTMAMLIGGCGTPSAGSAPPVPPASLVDGQLVLRARDVAFTPAIVTMTTNAALTVVLDNQDAGVPHDVVLRAGPGEGTELGKTEIVTGIAQAQLAVPPLVPGAYRFTCTVHPTMVTVLTVVPSS